MTDIKTIEGTFTGGKGNYTIVVGRWNSFVVEHLLEGAIDTLRRHGISDKQISIVRAPGAFEIPLVCKKVAAKGDANAIIALGAVIRGGTPHFEYGKGIKRDVQHQPRHPARGVAGSGAKRPDRNQVGCGGRFGGQSRGYGSNQ